MLPEMILDSVGRKLVNLLQEGLPLEKDPYGIIARDLDISRSEVTERIGALVDGGVIRRIGGVFDSAAMGYSSLLVGAAVPGEIFGDAAAFVNSFPGVTHNYRRSGPLNMWFTFASGDPGEIDGLLAALRERFGLSSVYPFPKVKHFKLRVFFDMEKE
ncbi:AsnC family transcriptional regulator [Aminivibrio pyruvatiphilus]|uniref:siroheme decarboxylase n=1 Tax=Aminivibrio pyruvatiphilus TaxID=1005740 RepID=A0A4R8MGT4_9BACT|nr:AsnC family transcriptional regulator [Aminivibrio pyruvatiphilus]